MGLKKEQVPLLIGILSGKNSILSIKLECAKDFITLEEKIGCLAAFLTIYCS